MYTSVVVSYCNVLFKRTLSGWVNSLNMHLKMLELMVTVKSILTNYTLNLNIFVRPGI